MLLKKHTNLILQIYLLLLTLCSTVLKEIMRSYLLMVTLSMTCVGVQLFHHLVGVMTSFLGSDVCVHQLSIVTEKA